MNQDGGQLSASELAINSYMDELLQESPEEPANTGGAVPALDQESRYYLFEISGLQIAVAAERVGSGVPMPQTVNGPLNVSWEYCASVDEMPLTIIDTAVMILPEDLAPRNIPLAERSQHVLLLDNGSWAIAIEQPGEEMSLDLQAVCWRGPRGRRGWLAGTVANKRCVLLDLDGIRQLTESR